MKIGKKLRLVVMMNGEKLKKRVYVTDTLRMEGFGFEVMWKLANEIINQETKAYNNDSKDRKRRKNKQIN